jgi:hypothetical protein
MRIHADSHVDHLPAALLALLVERHADLRPESGVLVTTLPIPASWTGERPVCALWGPAMGDAPIPESDVTYAVRGEREGSSRMIDRLGRPAESITVVIGPHDGAEDVLFTAYAGPEAPREPWDSSISSDEERAASEAFWALHALASH